MPWNNDKSVRSSSEDAMIYTDNTNQDVLNQIWMDHLRTKNDTRMSSGAHSAKLASAKAKVEDAARKRQVEQEQEKFFDRLGTSKAKSIGDLFSAEHKSIAMELANETSHYTPSSPHSYSGPTRSRPVSAKIRDMSPATKQKMLIGSLSPAPSRRPKSADSSLFFDSDEKTGRDEESTCIGSPKRKHHNIALSRTSLSSKSALSLGSDGDDDDNYDNVSNRLSKQSRVGHSQSSTELFPSALATTINYGTSYTQITDDGSNHDCGVRQDDTKSEHEKPSAHIGVNQSSTKANKNYENLDEVFLAFCNANKRQSQISLFGSDTTQMDGRTFQKFAKDCDLLQKPLTSTSVDIVFAKVKSKGTTKITALQFYKAVKELAKIRFPNHSESDAFGLVYTFVTHSSGPKLNSKVKVSNTNAVKRLTDTSQYTGAHKKRFDGEGRGLGKSGRTEESTTISDLSQITRLNI